MSASAGDNDSRFVRDRVGGDDGAGPVTGIRSVDRRVQFDSQREHHGTAWYPARGPVPSRHSARLAESASAWLRSASKPCLVIPLSEINSITTVLDHVERVVPSGGL